MKSTGAAWLLVMAVSAAGIACGSNVSVEPTGTGGGGNTSQGGAGATASTGGAGAEGGSGGGEAGGNPAGGSGQGGSTVGGGPSGGSGGVGGSGGEGGGPVCPGYGDPCTNCMSTGCAEVYCGCYDEAHCFGYLQCLGTCMMGDTACAQSCAAVHEPGISLGLLTADCAATACDAACNVGNALNGCQKCLYTECANQMNACIANPECLALIQCVQMCAPGDQGCSQACVSQHPDGFSDAQAVRMCRIDNCEDVCP